MTKEKSRGDYSILITFLNKIIGGDRGLRSYFTEYSYDFYQQLTRDIDLFLYLDSGFLQKRFSDF